MPGKIEDIEKLGELQDADNILEEGAEQFNNSPIATQIEDIRKKKQEYKAKRDQVDGVFVKAREEVEKVSLKDSQLAAAQEKEQKEIEDTQGDYRKVEAHTNKLNELTNQRKLVDEQLAKLEANFSKIKELKEKLDNAISSVSMKEDDLNKQLEQSNVQLKLDMDEATEKKKQLENVISHDALDLYKKSRNIVGKRVIANLEGDSCSVCRANLSSGNLSKVHADAPIAMCPNCSRVLIVK